MGEAMRALLAVNPWHLLIVAVLVACDRAVMIWRWIAAAERLPVSAGAAALHLPGQLVRGNFLPAGVGGDAAGGPTR